MRDVGQLSPNVTIETERLVLRPIEMGDVDAVYACLSDSDVTFNLLGDPLTREEAATLVRRWRNAIRGKTAHVMAITRKSDGLFMGVCALLRISWEHRHAELVYWLGKEHWGMGYMTEAVRAIVNFGFKHLKLERIEAGCFTRNAASRRVLEKVGFKYEGCARHKYFKSGEFLDEYRFGILREDFSSG